MLLLSGNMTLCGKLPIINTQHLHWITITTYATNHNPNHEGVTNHKYYEPKLDLSKHMLNHQLHQNQFFVLDIQPFDAGEDLRAYTNVEHQDYDHTTTLKISPWNFFFNDISLVDILFFAAVASKFSITIDTELDPSINVQLQDGKRKILNQCGGGLYYFDTINKDFDEDQNTEWNFLNTLESNKSCFNRRQIKGEDKVIILQKIVGWTSTHTLK